MKREFKEFIIRLEKELERPLPGEKYQYMMAPAIRRKISKDYPERMAAVLVLLYPQGNKIMLVFIKRKEYEGPHGGQISFPGGMYEDHDRDLKQTALRETEEETGIDKDRLKIIGKLSSLHIPVSNIIVHPFVGYLSQVPVFTPDPGEVDFMITRELDAFYEPSCRKYEEWNLSGEAVEVPFFSINSYRVWGATAMMLSEFLEITARSGLPRNPDHN